MTVRLYYQDKTFEVPYQNKWVLEYLNLKDGDTMQKHHVSRSVMFTNTMNYVERRIEKIRIARANAAFQARAKVDNQLKLNYIDWLLETRLT